MSEDTSTGCVPAPNDHVHAATRAVHALWSAHRQLWLRYQQRFDADHAWREAITDIADALLPSAEHLDSERAESLIDSLLGLLHEMRTQAERAPLERGCAWPVRHP